jgi:hypothetical protein
MDILTCAIMQHKRSPSRLVIVAEFTWSTWRDRNTAVFQQQRQHTPLTVILKSCIKTLVALKATFFLAQKLARVTQDIFTIQVIVDSLPA